MPVKIRLQRFGKKAQPFYHIVVADSRAPRDGKYIENIGVYNPRTNPATIEINQEKAMQWLAKGAQPSDTCRAILSYSGVLYKKHLDGGVKRGVVSQEAADTKFNSWLEQKNLKISQKSQTVMNEKKDAAKNRLAEEAKLREKIAEKVAAKHMAEAEAAAAPVEAPAETEAAPTEGDAAAPAEGENA